jgi:hypothetical protein
MKDQDKNMELWLAVETTDPAYTKKVNQRGGFTAIDAQWQLMVATQQWGPYGTSWGVKDLSYDYVRVGDTIAEVGLEATFWYPGGEFSLGTDMLYRPGNESKKKLLTDLTTKALSKLGFSADVFMGKFDDNRYVQELKAAPAAPRQQAPQRQAPSNGTSDTSDPHPDWPVPVCYQCGGTGERKRGTKGNQSPFRCMNEGCEEQGRDGKSYRTSYWRASDKAIGMLKALVSEYREDRGGTYDEVKEVLVTVVGVPDSSKAMAQQHCSKAIQALQDDLKGTEPLTAEVAAVEPEQDDIPF